MFYNVLATKLKSASMYLDWYVHVSKLKYDLRSSGISHFTYDLTMSNLDLSASFNHGNPETTAQLARLYGVNPESFFLSSARAVGNSPNLVQLIAAELLSKNGEKLEQHKQKWTSLRQQTQQWLERGLEFFPSKVGVTFWARAKILTNGQTDSQFHSSA